MQKLHARVLLCVLLRPQLLRGVQLDLAQLQLTLRLLSAFELKGERSSSHV